MAGYDIFRIQEPRKPELVFYVPHKIRGDCAAIMYPGFGRTADDYRRAGELVAEDDMIGVVTEWHDGGLFTENTMIESVYYPVDFLRKELKHTGKIVGVGHSFGGERLLKAAVADRKGRFDGVTAIQPPENLRKYIKNHSVLYLGAKMPYLRVPLTLFARLRHPALRVRSKYDGEWLTNFIDTESSLFDFIRDAPDGYSVPTQIIHSPQDRHVNNGDALRAKELLSEKGPAILKEVEIPKLETKLTDRNIEIIFRHATAFNLRVARGEFEPDEQETYRSTLGVEIGLEKPEKTETHRPTIELGDAYGFSLE